MEYTRLNYEEHVGYYSLGDLANRYKIIVTHDVLDKGALVVCRFDESENLVDSIPKDYIGIIDVLNYPKIK